MNVISTATPEVLTIEPKVFDDQRGFFLETFKADRYAQMGISRPFVQDNLSRSNCGGNPEAQGNRVTVLRGRVRDVAVDVRVRSAGVLRSG
jgi:dTDP-4-dehydrorhamnose 3,5-epimerase